MSSGRFFTAREDEFIKANFGSVPIRDIASGIQRSFGGVNKRIRALGIKTRPMRQWSPEEDRVIWDSAGKPIADVSKLLGRHISAVSERWKKIGDGTTWATRVGYKPHKGRRVIAFNRKDGHSQRVFEHRHIASGLAGRDLASDEIVHHIDLDKGNNEIDNLFICKGPRAHRLAHISAELLVPGLLRRGIVRFNRTEGVYELCETDK